MNAFMKKYFRIYFLIILGLALFIVCTIGIVEIMSRLQPDNQVLYVAPEETEQYDNILKIYVWETVWNQDKTIESYKLTEMALGEVIHVGDLRKPQDENGNNTETASKISRYFSYTHSIENNYMGEAAVFIAKADAELSAVNSKGGGALDYGKPTSDYLTPVYMNNGTYIGNVLAEDAQSTIRLERSSEADGRYEMIIAAGTYHKTARNGSSAEDDELGTGTWTNAARNDYSYQFLNEIYPQVESKYQKIYRYVCESAVLVSAYDKTNPEKLISQAELKIIFFSGWHKGDADITNGEFNIFMKEYGLSKNPDSYGYTTAELVDYWELEEWE
ncbi:MAG: hypothetical protein IJ493_06815 [Clostridia bacterium]|nr:hypothetical protein [Clostridia bacterium]